MAHDDFNIDRIDSLYQIVPPKPADKESRQQRRKKGDHDPKSSSDSENKHDDSFDGDDLSVRNERHEIDFQA